MNGWTRDGFGEGWTRLDGARVCIHGVAKRWVGVLPDATLLSMAAMDSTPYALMFDDDASARAALDERHPMPPEAAKLQRTVLDLGLISAIPRQPQVQGVLDDQLRAVVIAARRLGLCDAADLVTDILRRKPLRPKLDGECYKVLLDARDKALAKARALDGASESAEKGSSMRIEMTQDVIRHRATAKALTVALVACGYVEADVVQEER